MASKLLIVFALLIVGLGYMLYQPTSPDEANPWKLGVINGMFGISFLGGFLGEKLRLGTQLNISRSLLAYVLRVAGPSVDPQHFQTEDTTFNGVPVRIYRPKKSKSDSPLPAMVFMHGGGWVTGSVFAYDFLAAHFAVEANIVVVSVEYRMAPEHPFPLPLEDCRTAVEHFINNAAQFNVDPKRVALGGDSAGGNLAAAVSLMLRDANFRPMPKSQVLIYPVLQLLDFNTPSRFKTHQLQQDDRVLWMIISMYLDLPKEYADAMSKNRHVTQALRQKYGGFVNPDMLPKDFVPSDYKPTDPNYCEKMVLQEAAEIFVHPYVSPGLAEDLRGLPETFIFTAGGDGFRDDGAMFAERLKRAAIKHTYLNIRETFHGCCNYVSGPVGTENGRKANIAIVKFLKETL